jgi:tetrapyrrole methylase family protein/MazG family protein
MTTAVTRLTIVGLGPGDPDLRTIGTQHALDQADAIILRTRIHPGLDDLAADSRVSDCDDLYQCTDRFHDLYLAIADRVLDRLHRGGQVVFAVPGHPRFGERSVALLEMRCRELGIPVHVLAAVSFVDAVVNAIGADPLEQGLQVADAERLAAAVDTEPYAAGLLGIDPARPLLIAQIYNASLAAAVKLALSRLYPDAHTVQLVRGADTGQAIRIETMALHEFDRQEPDHLTSLWVPALQPLAAVRSPETLARLVARLRAPGGCPWDREQTHGSLRNALIEEAYETVDAIDDRDDGALMEELGDLQLLVMMHAQMAEEAGSFGIEDVYEAIGRKLIRRHPHVFGAETAETPDAVIATWEGVKAAERAAKGQPAANKDAFARVPRSMPATRKAIELLAPRATLSPPEDGAAGNVLLDAIIALIEQGIDPESALEASLRHRATAAEPQMANSMPAAGKPESDIL